MHAAGSCAGMGIGRMTCRAIAAPAASGAVGAGGAGGAGRLGAGQLMASGPWAREARLLLSFSPKSATVNSSYQARNGNPTLSPERSEREKRFGSILTICIMSFESFGSASDASHLR